MAKLIVRSQYYTKEKSSSVKGYITYMGTRKNVELLPRDMVKAPPSSLQQETIQGILAREPELSETLEYEDYEKTPSYAAAREFIKMALEQSENIFSDQKNLLEYMGRRSGVEKLGAHGLFSESGVPEDIEKAAAAIAAKETILFSHVISLRREDAARLGYDKAKSWQSLVAANAPALAKAHKIPLENLRYAAAFHDESHHPHIHLAVYSNKKGEGYLNQAGINTIRSSFADKIFRQDMLHVYEEKTVWRDDLRKAAKEKLHDIVKKISASPEEHSEIELLLKELSVKLKKHKGRKQYGAIRDKDILENIHQIVDALERVPEINEMYQLWYKQQDEIMKLYQKNPPIHKSLHMQEEFRPVMNAVIKTALEFESIQPSPEADAMFKDLSPSEAEIPAPEKDIIEMEIPTLGEHDGTSVGMEASEMTQDVSEVVEAHETITTGPFYIQWSDAYKKAKSSLYAKDVDTEKREAALNSLFKESAKGNALAIYEMGMLYRKGLGTPVNEKKSQMFLETAFEAFKFLYDKKPSGFLTYRLGKMYCQGIGTEVDYDKAFSLFTKAADDGNLYAKYSLGSLYFYGNGTDVDYEEAFQLFQEATETGNPFAYYKVAEMSAQGVGTVVDQELAQRHFKIALKGFLEMTEKTVDDTMLNRIGQMYMMGLGTEPDYEKAEQYFKQAIKMKNENARYNFAKLYLKEDYLEGFTEKQQMKKQEIAVKMLHKLMKNGNDKAKLLLAQYYTGKRYRNNVDDENKTKNIGKGIHWMKELIAQGNAYAKYALSSLYLDAEYLDTLPEVEKSENVRQAEQWLRELIAGGHHHAGYRLGKYYLSKTYRESDYPEKDRNIKEGVQWLEELAQAGNAYAKYTIGSFFIGSEYLESLPEPEQRKKLAQAEQWLHDILDHNSFAKFALARYYLSKNYRETFGKTQNVADALQWLEDLAQEGNLFAHTQLGCYYLYGEARDIEKALLHLKIAADGGDAFATRVLDNYNQFALKAAVGDLVQKMAKFLGSDYAKNDNKHFTIDRKLLQKEFEKKQSLGMKV